MRSAALPALLAGLLLATALMLLVGPRLTALLLLLIRPVSAALLLAGTRVVDFLTGILLGFVRHSCISSRTLCPGPMD